MKCRQGACCPMIPGAERSPRRRAGCSTSVGFTGWVRCSTRTASTGASPGWSSFLTNCDGLLLYQGATRYDQFDFTYPPTDGGSSGLGLAKALKRSGVID